MDNWYYKLFGDEFGPVTIDALIELAKGHTLSANDEVRFGESGPWRRAGSMGQLMAHMPSGAHIPTAPAAVSAVNSKSSASIATVSTKATEPVGWYYQSFGEDFGPLSFDDLVELAKNHTLSVDDQVRFGDSGPWRRAGSIGQLMAHLPFQAGKNAFSIELDQAALDNEADELDSLFNGDATIPLMDMAPIQPIPAPVRKRNPTPVEPIPIAVPEPEPEPEIEKQELYWCMISGKEYGPVELPKLIEWAANGRLLRKDFVRKGLDAYVVADELPGLFPELPKAAVETKAEIKSMTRTMPTASAAPMPAPAPVIETPRPEYTPPTPNPMASANFSRPTVPVRRPPSKSSSSDMSKLLTPILGTVGVLVLGALIYFALPYLPLGDSADVTNFKALRTAYSEVQAARNAENPPSKDEFKKVGDKLVSSVKPIEAKLKGKSPATVKLRSLAKKLQDLGKEDLSKASDAEKTIGKSFESLAKLLKVK